MAQHSRYAARRRFRLHRYRAPSAQRVRVEHLVGEYHRRALSLGKRADVGNPQVAGYQPSGYDVRVFKRITPQLLLLCFVGCAAARTLTPASTLQPPPSTPLPADCGDLEAAWGDWPTTVSVLELLIASNQECGDRKSVV